MALKSTCSRCTGRMFFTEWTNTYRCFTCEKKDTTLSTDDSRI